MFFNEVALREELRTNNNTMTRRWHDIKSHNSYRQVYARNMLRGKLI